MKKFLLFGTILAVASGAFAFGGIGIGKLQRHKSSGVDAIGIHIDDKGGANIKTECPAHSTWSDETLKCECDTWYAMNEETHQCEETCATIQQCGNTCCGARNICVDGNKCCHKDYEGDEEMCCDASVSTGYANTEEECIEKGSTFALLHSDGGDTHKVPITALDSFCDEEGKVLIEYKQSYYCCPPDATNGYDMNDDVCLE